MTVVAEILRRQTIEEAHHQLTTGREFVAGDRYTGVADGATIVDLYLGLPSDAERDALVAIAVDPGGLTHFDVTDGASVDTAGTALPTQQKSTANTMATTVEAGGTYSAPGTTIPGVISGTQRTGGPTTSTSAQSVTDVRLLQPGDGFEYILTNQSGSSIDCGVSVQVIEIERA